MMCMERIVSIQLAPIQFPPLCKGIATKNWVFIGPNQRTAIGQEL